VDIPLIPPMPKSCANGIALSGEICCDLVREGRRRQTEKPENRGAG
jgi:hypothetical protein